MKIPVMYMIESYNDFAKVLMANDTASINYIVVSLTVRCHPRDLLNFNHCD